MNEQAKVDERRRTRLKIEQFAMDKAELSMEDRGRAIYHLISCRCPCCVKFNNYIFYKEMIQEWEAMDVRASDETSQGLPAGVAPEPRVQAPT